MKKIEWSLPMRGEWIEISDALLAFFTRESLSPCGESGLKCFNGDRESDSCKSLPMRGEWIEIMESPITFASLRMSLPMRGEWIEIPLPAPFLRLHGCLSPCGESGLKFSFL